MIKEFRANLFFHEFKMAHTTHWKLFNIESVYFVNLTKIYDKVILATESKVGYIWPLSVLSQQLIVCWYMYRYSSTSLAVAMIEYQRWETPTVLWATLNQLQLWKQFKARFGYRKRASLNTPVYRSLFNYSVFFAIKYGNSLECLPSIK